MADSFDLTDLPKKRKRKKRKRKAPDHEELLAKGKLAEKKLRAKRKKAKRSSKRDRSVQPGVDMTELLELDLFREVTHPKKRAYLVAYALVGVKHRAASLAGISVGNLYTTQWREDIVFQKAAEMAEELSADLLVAEAHRRAVEGTEEPTGWFRGQAGGTVRKYSDTLLIVLLKMRGRFKDGKTLEHTGPGGGPMQYEDLSDDALRKRASGLTNRVAAAMAAADEN